MSFLERIRVYLIFLERLLGIYDKIYSELGINEKWGRETEFSEGIFNQNTFLLDDLFYISINIVFCFKPVRLGQFKSPYEVVKRYSLGYSLENCIFPHNREILR